VIMHHPTNCLNSAQHGGPPAPPPSLRSRVGFGGSGSGLGLGLLPCRVGSLGGGGGGLWAGRRELPAAGHAGQPVACRSRSAMRAAGSNSGGRSQRMTVVMGSLVRGPTERFVDVDLDSRRHLNAPGWDTRLVQATIYKCPLCLLIS